VKNINSSHVMWLLMKKDISRFLFFNSYGKINTQAAEDHHDALCRLFIACYFECNIYEVNAIYPNEKVLVCEATKILTENMPAVIGYTLISEIDYEKLEPSFFKIFVELAAEVLEVKKIRFPATYMAITAISKMPVCERHGKVIKKIHEVFKGIVRFDPLDKDELECDICKNEAKKNVPD